MLFLKNKKANKLLDHQQQPEEPDLIPLINIIFLLLLFFMVAGQVASPTNHATLPYSEFSLPSEGHEADLTMDDQHQIHIMGTPVSEKKLPEALALWRQQNSPEVIFKINIPMDNPASDITNLMNIIKKSGIEHLAIATKSSPLAQASEVQ